jgi:hypothetical protein
LIRLMLSDVHGSGLRRNRRAKRETQAAADVTIGSLSKPFFGSRAPARRGAICRKRSANGSPSIRASPAGLIDDPDFEYVLIDGTLVRVHQHGTGAKGGLKISPSAARVAA